MSERQPAFADPIPALPSFVTTHMQIDPQSSFGEERLLFERTQFRLVLGVSKTSIVRLPALVRH